jgi:hypothetical protein
LIRCHDGSPFASDWCPGEVVPHPSRARTAWGGRRPAVDGLGPAPRLSRWDGPRYTSHIGLPWRTANDRTRLASRHGPRHHTRGTLSVAEGRASTMPTRSSEGDSCMAQTPSSPPHQQVRLRTYRLPGGWQVLVGRTDADNDDLTFRVGPPGANAGKFTVSVPNGAFLP